MHATISIASIDERRFSGYETGVYPMRTIFLKAMMRAAWVSITLAAAGVLWVFAPGQAAAGFCSSTSCSLTLTNSNFIGTGTFGTVKLALSSNVVTVDVNLASAYRIIRTGFPGAAGFADSLGGGLTIGNFKTGGVSTALYSGSRSLPLDACSNKDCKWSGFGGREQCGGARRAAASAQSAAALFYDQQGDVDHGRSSVAAAIWR